MAQKHADPANPDPDPDPQHCFLVTILFFSCNVFIFHEVKFIKYIGVIVSHCGENIYCTCDFVIIIAQTKSLIPIPKYPYCNITYSL
jgi:hypothetical protein